MQKLVISAPFGNYLNFPHATSTLGTFTHEFRAGPLKRLWRVLKTVRYYPGISAWKNKLGLPNPGIDWLSGQVGCGRIDPSDKIVSISARETSDWTYLLGSCTHLIRPGYVELNISCPNCPGEYDHSDYEVVFRDAVALFGERAIVKLPPVGYAMPVKQALAAGIVSFHCCNTLWTPGGGLSGSPLKLLSLQATQHVRESAFLQNIKLEYLIGGGGNKTAMDVHDFLKAGATNAAVASVLFWPWYWRRIKNIAKDLADEGRWIGDNWFPR